MDRTTFFIAAGYGALCILLLSVLAYYIGEFPLDFYRIAVVAAINFATFLYVGLKGFDDG